MSGAYSYLIILIIIILVIYLLCRRYSCLKGILNLSKTSQVQSSEEDNAEQKFSLSSKEQLNGSNNLEIPNIDHSFAYVKKINKHKTTNDRKINQKDNSVEINTLNYWGVKKNRLCTSKSKLTPVESSNSEGFCDGNTVENKIISTLSSKLRCYRKSMDNDFPKDKLTANSAFNISEFLYVKFMYSSHSEALDQYINLVLELFIQTYSETDKRLLLESNTRIKSLLDFSELLVKSVYGCTKNSPLIDVRTGYMFYDVCDYFFSLCEDKVRNDINRSQIQWKTLPVFTPKTKKNFDLIYSHWLEHMNVFYSGLIDRGKYYN